VSRWVYFAPIIRPVTGRKSQRLEAADVLTIVFEQEAVDAEGIEKPLGKPVVGPCSAVPTCATAPAKVHTDDDFVSYRVVAGIVSRDVLR
jgi:hypothetical protein